MGLKLKSRKRARLESGQGTVEYILILALVVFIALGILYRFHNAFKGYAVSLFDGYYSCLLETGELPGNSPICTEEFKDFNPNAKSLVSERWNEGGSNGNNRNNQNNRAQNDQQRNEGNRNRSELKSGGGGGGGGGSTPVGRFNDYGRNRMTPVAKVEGGSTDKATTAIGGISTSGSRPSGTVYRTPNRGAVRTEYATYESEEEKKKASERPTSRSAGKVDDGSSALRPKKSVEKPRRAVASDDGSKGEGFTIGGFLRMFLIIALIIAIVVFLGGQLLQVSKSGEKGSD